jgi:orotidine-5'-phosphate decarboxylase
MKPTQNASPIILALDYSDMTQARSLLEKVRPHIGMIKIGLEMFTANGFNSFSLSEDFKVPIFLDLKLHDVPTTVSKTVKVLCEKLAPIQGEHFLSIHATGGREMCEKALETAAGSNVTITAITLLTSLDKSDLQSLAVKGVPSRFAGNAAVIANDCLNHSWAPSNPNHNKGIKHLVCPPAMIKTISQYLHDDTVYICPGIRATSDDANDHAKAVTASAAIKGGADWLVVGRPITEATDPVSSAVYFLEQANKNR